MQQFNKNILLLAFFIVYPNFGELLISHLFYIIIFNLIIKNPDFIIAYEIESILFAIIVVMLSMKIKINNNLAYWFGKNLFGLYMLQRIPMLILKEVHLNNYVYAILCFGFMVLLAYLIKYIKKLFKRK